jgi:anti-anti-sigma regulatory factor
MTGVMFASMPGFWARPGIAVRAVIPSGFTTTERSTAIPYRPADAPSNATRFDVRLSRTMPRTVVISLLGNHDASAAAALGRIAQSELAQCDRLIIDFSHIAELDTDVVTALVDIAVRARTNAIPFQIVSRPQTYAHDLLDTFGILERLDCTTRLPELEH